MWHPSPIFPTELLSASVSDRLAYFSERFLIEHPVLASCQSDIKRVLFKNKQYQIINVFGPTGVGKSELAKNVEKMAFEITAKSCSNVDYVGLPAVYIEVPLKGSAVFDWKDFYREILKAMNAPPERLCRSVKIPENLACGRGYSQESRKLGELRSALEERIRELKLKVLILDETQHFFMFTQKNIDSTLHILKSIANRTGCQIVLVGTYESLNQLSWNGPLSRRVKKIHFRRYQWNSRNDQEDFAASYMGLLSHIPHELDKELFEFSTVKYLYKVSCGCVGILKQLLEKAFDRNQCQCALKLSDLKAEALSVKDLVQIATEIVEGEAFFKKEPISKLEHLLGVKVVTSKIKQSTKKASARNSKPGKRKPVRDKAGIDA